VSPPRRVPKIRTIGGIQGKRNDKGEAHVHQFHIACLELERTRRLKEKEAAMQRVENLDLRLAEIDADMVHHQESIALIRAGRPPAPTPRRASSAAQMAAAPPEQRAKKTLRY
jgi:hypothetical protein